MAESGKKSAAKQPKKDLVKTTPKKNGKKDFFVVGLGASAGGVKALQEFFASMPPNSGMAFVVILHLSPNHESNLDHILQVKTEMPVFQVNETLKVEPNNVYVIPPNQHLEMVDGVIRPAKKANEPGIRAAIDVFFRTLADAYQENAVCVVLSGTGSDGTSGLKRVKETNGFAVVQSPEDAEYDQMPRSAIATNLADWILPIALMPEKLLSFKASSERLHLTDDDAEKIAQEINADESLREILTVLRVRTGHDFSNYKKPTLVRRIARHLQIHELEDIPTYLNLMRDNPEEILSLQRNLLINVTNFFRDKESFSALEREVIPNLFAGKNARDTVRVWSAACASGEEAYSLAMLLSEYASRLSDPPKFQVFATDVDDEAIAEARDHTYPETIEADVSPERLKRFFNREGKHYRIKKELRETVLFAPHNVLRDPPFSKLDLVTCRNLLIYLNRETQERVMEIFHFALSLGGYLFLGSSETAENVAHLFAPVDKKHRLYSRRAAHHNHQFNAPKMPLAGKWQVKIPDRKEIQARNKAFSLGEVHYKLLEKFAPPSVLVNQDFDVLYMSETVGRYMRFAGGEPTSNILKLVHPDLLPDLRAALFTAQQERQASEFPNVRLTIDGEAATVNLIVRSVSIEEDSRELLLVIFDEAGKSKRLPSLVEDDEQRNQPVQVFNKDEAMEAVINRLEKDLQRTRTQLRSTIEQHEISIEELKASNEELQAINEELRSASEELETSKEESQSVNEELTTVNHELKDKIDEATHANSDMQNLMAATDIATIFLDRHLQIKRYTPQVEDFFSITKNDIGRPLAHFTHKLNYDNLAMDAEKVLRRLAPVEHEITDKDGRYFLARFAPYRTLDDRIDGVVLNFIDITERKQAEDAVAADLRGTEILRNLAGKLVTEENAQTIYDEILAAAIELTKAAGGTLQILEQPSQELTFLATKGFKRKMTDYYRHVDATSETSCGIALKTGTRFFVDFDDAAAIDADGSMKLHREAGYLSAQSTPLVARSGEPIGMISTHWRTAKHRPSERELRFLDLLARQAADLIEQRQAEKTIYKSEKRFRAFLTASYEAVYRMNADWTEMRSLVGKDFLPDTEHPNRSWLETYIHADDRAQVLQTINRAVETKTVFELEHRVVRVDGTLGWTQSRAVPMLDNAGEIIEWFGTAQDITPRKVTEEALRESEERLRIATSAARMYSWEFDAGNETYKFSANAAEILGVAQKRLPVAAEDAFALVHPDDLETVERELRKTLKTGKGFNVEIRSIKDNGEIICLNVETAVVKNAGKKPSRIIGIAQDVTERRRFENAARKSDERLRIAVKAAQLATWDWNVVTDEVVWNEQHFKLFGMKPTKEKLTSKAFTRHVHPDDLERVGAELQKAVETGELFESEFRIVRDDDGATRWMEGYGHAVEQENGKTSRMSGVMSDITTRKNTEEAVRHSEERLQLVMKSITDYAVITSNPEGIINSWNTGAENTFGWTEAEAVGQPCAIIFTAEDRSANLPQKEMDKALKNGVAEDTRWHVRKDGSRFFASGTVSPVHDGEFEGFVKITSDQTDRMMMQKTLREKELLQKLVKAQEDERKRIARDLHDELGQQLTALRLKLQTTRKISADEIVSGKIDEMQLIARQIDDGVDFLAWELRPSVLDDLGLFVALDKYVREWSHFSGVRAELLASSLKKARFLPEVETNLYRIVQEALNNAHKHAGAKSVEVLFEKRENLIVLIIADNGKGFKPEDKKNRGKGIGLTGMTERAALIGGTFEIESAPGEGTSIYVRVPIAAAKEEKKR